MKVYPFVILVLSLAAFLASPAAAFTANTLSVTLDGNGDATIVFTYTLSSLETAAVYMKIADPATELEKALESNFGKDVVVKSVTTSKAEFTVKEFAAVQSTGTQVTMTTPEIDLRKAQDIVKDQWYAKYLKLDFSPTTTTVMFPDGWSQKFSNAEVIPSISHTFTRPAPTVTGITPSSGKAGQIVAITNLAGNNFVSDATVALARSGSSDIPGTGVVVVSSSSITCSFTIPGAAPLGPWNVVVTNPDGKVGSKAGAFTVISPNTPPPTVESISPTSGKAGTTVTITSLTGTGFIAGATAAITNQGSSIPITDLKVASATKITGKVVIPSTAVLGSWNVVVTNTDGQVGSKAGAFTVVSPPPPTVKSISPTSGKAGTTVTITSLTGTNFKAGATAAITNGGSSIPITDLKVASATKITGKVVIPSTATKGYWNVVVTNTDGQIGTKSKGFQVK